MDWGGGCVVVGGVIGVVVGVGGACAPSGQLLFSRIVVSNV